jgi:Fic family protein
MSPEEFSEPQRKFLIRTITGAWAFAPPPLPPTLDLAAFALELGAAAAAIGELKGAARRLSNPYMLINPLIQKEALTSSAMEGTITTIENMILEQAKPTFFDKLFADTPQNENAREASNYVKAVRGAAKQLEEIPICHRLIKDAHTTLLSGLSTERGQGKRPGEYKQSQNAIGKQGDNEHTAKYVPPPPAETAVAMDDLEKYINRDNQKIGAGLLDIAIVHYQFEAIHPFLDGNGRVGRMLVTLMAMQSSLLDLPLLHVSAEIEKDRDKYIDLLFNVTAQANWSSWVGYFLDIIRTSCEAATAMVEEVLHLEKALKARAMESRKNHRLNTIIEKLFERPSITASEVQKLCGTHFQTAQSDLQQLVEAGILKKIESSWPQNYIAYEILAISKR